MDTANVSNQSNIFVDTSTRVSDMDVVEINNATTGVNDEIARHQMGRYINSNEAVWRILRFPIHDLFPTIVHLIVHLENGQRVYFTSDNAQERATKPIYTTFTAYFQLCQEDVSKSIIVRRYN
ncbi:hypothetical protein AVEN_135751-1 [Araneus ventricosus]|uniref:Helitron helicase-like domain-containing protein n=1 Tax=Araneus ventricosus TaxID=182803 RepID=A0A4Y2TGU4_ARAVE|nr:hypothetical protein AVEN_135751-1 [Araneus ventricosus]